MCPVVLLSLIFSVFLFLFEVTASLTVAFAPSQNLTLREGSEGVVNFTIIDNEAYSLRNPSKTLEFEIAVKDDAIADVKGNRTFILTTEELRNNYSNYFTLSGKFLGKTSVFINPKKHDTTALGSEINSLDIIVKRKQTTISLVFTISVAVLVSLNYINMGCALETEVVKSVLRRPIAPALGFLSQYIVMPSVSLSSSRLHFQKGVSFFPGNIFARIFIVTRLATFEAGFVRFWLLSCWRCQQHVDCIAERKSGFIGHDDTHFYTCGCWYVIDCRQLQFLITILTGMLPLWMFTLGKQIYSGTTTTIPFRNILTTMISMTLCLGIGLLFQRFLPRVAKVRN